MPASVDSAPLVEIDSIWGQPIEGASGFSVVEQGILVVVAEANRAARRATSAHLDSPVTDQAR